MMTVGELVAYLRLDDGQFNRGLDQAHSKIGRVGGAIGTAVKRGAVVAGVAIAGLVGTTLVKGFKRLTAIEDASASLRGLGHSAEEVTLIMASAREAVLGTAFGLDEAASIAASSVASGIKPGQQLESTLRLVADAATIGKTSLGEMGAVFNKVAASNKMQGDVMAQLNDTGIPIQQFLAKSLGVTIDKVYELSKAGSISFPMFAKAMKEGLGGAALASGNTTIGAWKNMVTALSRFGADVLSGIFPSFKVAFNKVGAYLDQLGKKYSPIFKAWGEKVSAAFKTGGFTGMFKAMLPAGVGDTLITTFNVIKDTTVTIVRVIGTIAGVFGKLPGALQKFAIGAGVLALALGKFGLLGSAKGLFGGLLGKVGGGAATEVPLTTAVGLNTAATEANTLALLKGGILGGGGKTVATPLTPKPRTFYVDSAGNTTTTKPAPVVPQGSLGRRDVGMFGGIVASIAVATGLGVIVDAYDKWKASADEAAASSDTASAALKRNADKLGPEFVAKMQDAINRDTYKSPGVGGWAKSFVEGNFDTWIKPLWEGLQGHKVGEEEGKKTANAFAESFKAGITPASMSLHGAGLLRGLDPAILKTREKLAVLRQELAKKNKLGDTNTASTTTAIKRVEKHLADLRANAAKPAHTGRLNTSGWTGPISAAMQRLLEFRDLSSQGITPGSVSQHKSWTKANAAPAPVWRAPGHFEAAGGDFMVSKPTLFVAGEAGPERATFTPKGKVPPGTSGGGDVHVHIGQLVGTDERAARQLAGQVGQILMSKQRLKGAMSRG